MSWRFASNKIKVTGCLTFVRDLMTLLILCAVVQYQRNGKKSDHTSHKHSYILITENGNQISLIPFFFIPHATYFPHVIFSITLKVGGLSKD